MASRPTQQVECYIAKLAVTIIGIYLRLLATLSKSSTTSDNTNTLPYCVLHYDCFCIEGNEVLPPHPFIGHTRIHSRASWEKLDERTNKASTQKGITRLVISTWYQLDQKKNTDIVNTLWHSYFTV